MKRYNNWYSPDFNLRIVELTRELDYKNSSVLRKEFVKLNVLKHNKGKKRYELTKAAISCGLGEIRMKINTNYPAQFNVFNVQAIVDLLNQGIPL